MNLPNKLTIFRIILVPFFAFFILAENIGHHYLFALLFFCAASFTDMLDGKIARKNNQITDFGKFLDPLADKILVMTALICFVAQDLVNIWFVLLIMFREFAVTSIRLVAVGKSGKVIAANIWGKMKTVSQIIAIIVILVFAYVNELGAMQIITVSGQLYVCSVIIDQLFMAIATFMSLYSGYIYLREYWDIIGNMK
jgi:CDP-diacylglycerol--glycerol-3-phosphate 3-phosphatidyltransferase